MRVLHVQRAKGVSGSERHLLSLLPALGAVGVETRMCVLSTGDGSRFVDELSASGIDVTVRNAGGDLNAKLVPELMAEIRSFRPDIVHTHLFHADLAGQVAAMMSRVRGITARCNRV
jgi:Glycosyltransferase Family 4